MTAFTYLSYNYSKIIIIIISLQTLLWLATLYTNSKSSRLVFQVALSQSPPFSLKKPAQERYIVAGDCCRNKRNHTYWCMWYTATAEQSILTIKRKSTMCVTPHVHCYVLYAYLYCVYALVGGAISIRDPYICAVSRVCANESYAVFHRPLSVQ